METSATGLFGGFCYFNNAAIALQYLSTFGKVAILDLNYHHDGNGQQDIFYHRFDVFTLSLHGHPRFAPAYLVVCFGLDTAKGDPTGTWSFQTRDFNALGRVVGGLKIPTLVVQEGGYRIRSLGGNCRSFLLGLRSGMENFSGVDKNTGKK